MDRKESLNLADEIIAGGAVDPDRLKMLSQLPCEDVFELLPGIDMIREHFFGRRIHLCAICNVKSGACSEDCRFCSQSAHSKGNSPVYPLMTPDEIEARGRETAASPVNRFSLVASGKGLPLGEVERAAEALSVFRSTGLETCVSFGLMDYRGFAILKQAGVTRYHHNLESAESFFGRVCTTHSFEARIDTILAAKEAGLSVCTGGIFGLGETDQQVVEMALTLKDLDVDAVPINFLTPIRGTPMENHDFLSPLRCLKILALMRLALPDKDILICGGRQQNLKSLESLMFMAGASGLMTGNYLTTRGSALENDLALMEQSGFFPRKTTGGPSALDFPHEKEPASRADAANPY